MPISGHLTRNEFVLMMLKVFDGTHVDALHLNVLDVPVTCSEVVNGMVFELLCLRMVRSSASTSTSLVSVNCPTIYIELANTVGGNLLDRVPVRHNFTGSRRVHLVWNTASNPYVISPTLCTKFHSKK